MDTYNHFQRCVPKKANKNTPLYKYTVNNMRALDKIEVMELLVQFSNIDKYPKELKEVIRWIIHPSVLKDKIIIFDILDILTEELKEYFKTDILEYLVKLSLNHNSEEYRIKASQYLEQYTSNEDVSLIEEFTKQYSWKQEIQSTLESINQLIQDRLDNLTIPDTELDEKPSVTGTELWQLSIHLKNKKDAVRLMWDFLKLYFSEIYHIDRDFFDENIIPKQEKWFYLSELLYNKTADLVILEKNAKEELIELAWEYGIDIHYLEKIVVIKWYYSQSTKKIPLVNKTMTVIDISDEDIVNIKKYLDENM